MNNKGCSHIPCELFYWVTFLTQALPLRAIATFIELLIGAMLTQSGFVTDCYLTINMQRHWTSYYKWLQQGKWSWLALARQFLRLVLRITKPEVIYLAIDDTLTLRTSKKAPASQIHHQHGNKPNLAKYVRGQCWVSLAIVVKNAAGKAVSLPILSRLMPSSGNTGKLVAGMTLIRAIHSLLNAHSTVRVLVDSWYMRGKFIKAMNLRGYHVIGQARYDTRLYEQPEEVLVKKRGRPRKYGSKFTAEKVETLPAQVTELYLYGKKQLVRYRSATLKARFLDGQLVKAIWSQLQNDDGTWKSPCLILSTDSALSAEQIIEAYGLRWPIEPMFHELKQAWGMKEAWQQTRQVLHRWVHITMVGFGLTQLLSCISNPKVAELCNHSPWRRGNPITAGQIRKGLLYIFRHVEVRAWWNPKCKKFEPPTQQSCSSYSQTA